MAFPHQACPNPDSGRGEEEPLPAAVALQKGTCTASCFCFGASSGFLPPDMLPCLPSLSLRSWLRTQLWRERCVRLGVCRLFWKEMRLFFRSALIRATIFSYSCSRIKSSVLHSASHCPFQKSFAELPMNYQFSRLYFLCRVVQPSPQSIFIHPLLYGGPFVSKGSNVLVVFLTVSIVEPF